MTFTQEGGLGREAPWSQEMRSVSPVLKASSHLTGFIRGTLTKLLSRTQTQGRGGMPYSLAAHFNYK